MMHAIMTLAELNRQSREFWRAQGALLQKRMADDAIRETAFDIMQDEAKRGVEIYYQKSLYRALEDAEQAKHRFMTQQSRTGGKAKKTDALQHLIEQFVQRTPTITVRELENRLSEHQGIEPIQDIEEGTIYFSKQDGNTKRAKLSGLKDRLSRAKRKLKSR